MQIGAVLLSVWARLTFGLRSFHYAADPTPGRLVTTGPYRFVRNPIYTAVWLLTWAGIAVHLSLATAALGLLILAALVVRMLCEERLLAGTFSRVRGLRPQNIAPDSLHPLNTPTRATAPHRIHPDTALLIVGHGSTVNPDSGAPSLAHAAAIRRKRNVLRAGGLRVLERRTVPARLAAVVRR